MRARALIAALLAAITLLPLATAAQADAGGEVTLYGLYMPVPNHEVYVRAGAWPYTTIFRQTGLSFVCLYVNTGTCTDRSY